VEKTLLATHGGYAGQSLIERMETELLEATIHYLEVKDTLPNKFGDWEKELKQVGSARGKVRGLAIGVAVMRNTYLAGEAHVIRGIEREFVRLARTEIESGITTV
jgi:hypothetical protein